MADLDLKQIGLAAKDLIFGIGTAAAGTSGGPAAANGMAQAGNGLDRILSMAGVAETRGNQFDRADFAARPQAAAPAPAPTASAAPAPPTAAGPLALIETNEPLAASETGPAQEDGPLTGDARVTVEHLRTLGWSRNQIQQILRGPTYTSLAALVGKETKGFRAAGTAGTRVAQVEGAGVPSVRARVVPTAGGQAIPTVRGAPVKLDTGARGT